MGKVYLADVQPETFDPAAYLSSRIPSYDLMSPEQQKQARIAYTRDDPLLFAILYFRKLLRAGGDGITLADMHVDICKFARHFRKPLDAANPIRRAFIAPRRAGKSSWLFKILCTWVAAHGHRKFFLVVTATDTRAVDWVMNFRKVIDENALLRADYSDLCKPMVRKSTGIAYSDTSHLYWAASGFTLAAISTGSNRLGLNVDDERPDMIVFDDIEDPDDGLEVLEKRLNKVTAGIMPMGAAGASIIFVGTVHKPGTIMDQTREYAALSESDVPDPSSWIPELQLSVRHYKPFIDPVTREEFTHSFPGCISFWEGRHPLEKLLREEGTRLFAAEYANEPLPKDGFYWREGDISRDSIVRLTPKEPVITYMSIDPALKTKKKNDFTAVSIIRYGVTTRQFEILYGRAFKLKPGSAMPEYVTNLLSVWPEVRGVLIEDNAGGELWDEVYKDLPGRVKVERFTTTKSSKELRAALVLQMYQSGQVFHSTDPRADTKEIESEMYQFPGGLHDDLPDSVCMGILQIKKMHEKVGVQHRQSSYV